FIRGLPTMKRQFLSALMMTVAVLGIAVPAANATTFRLSTIQERSGETVLIEENAIENFRRQQREQ
ncbi:MAG: hypothetical protein AAGL17_06885, partial [Cyanobacteria bacterium J06576_12]